MAAMNGKMKVTKMKYEYLQNIVISDFVGPAGGNKVCEVLSEIHTYSTNFN